MTDKLTQPIYQLRYQLTRDDIAAFEFVPRDLLGWEKAWLFGPILALGAAAGYFEDELRAWTPWDPTTQLGQFLSVICAIALGYGLSIVLLTWRTRRRIAKAPLPDGPSTVDVYPEQVLANAGGIKRRPYLWREASLVEAPQHLFITQRDHPPLIIPARAFDSTASMQDFVLYARRRMSELEPSGDNEEKETAA